MSGFSGDPVALAEAPAQTTAGKEHPGNVPSANERIGGEDPRQWTEPDRLPHAAVLLWLERLAVALGVAAALTGLFWLGAWMNGAAGRWAAAGMLTVKTNMALAQLLGGVALIALVPTDPARWRRFVGWFAGAAVFAIGLLTLSEHLFGWDLGIDQWIASEPPGAAATLSPNRMGPPGCVTLTILGFGLMALAGGRRALAPYAGLLACLVQAVPALGFLYGIKEFYSQPRLTGIAWPSVIALASLGLGLMLAERERGPVSRLLRRDAGGALLRRLMPVALLVPVALGFLKYADEHYGVFGPEIRTGLVVLGVALGVAAVLWHSAARLSRSAEAESRALRKARADLAERRRTAEALRQSEERYRSLFDYMTEGFALHEIILDAAGRPADYRFLEINPAFVRLTGLDRRETVGRRVLEVLPGTEAVWIERYGQVALTGEPAHFESYHSPLGRWFEVLAYRPAPMQFATVFTDITERKQAEEALRRSQARYALLSDTAAALLASSDPQRTVETLCRRVMDHLRCDVFFNFLAEGAPGRLKLNACGGVDAATARSVGTLEFGSAVCGCVAVEKQRIIVEDILHSSDPRAGAVRSMGVQVYCCHPLLAGERLIGTLSFGSRTRPRLENDEIELMRAVSNLVSVAMERIRVENALRDALAKAEEGDRQLKALMEHVPEGITICDAEGRLRMVSRSGQEMLGCAHAGMTVAEVTDQWLVYEEDGRTPMPLERLPLMRAIRTGKAVEGVEIVQVSQAGRKLPLLCNAAPIRDSAGQVVGGIVAWRDITERKAFQEELERLVAERTAKLQELVAELEHFSYTITHDMRAPLRAMKGYCEVVNDLSAGTAPAEQKEFLRRIIVAAERMDALIRDALNYSRAVRQELPLEVVDLGALVRGMLDTYPEFQPSRAHIRLEGKLPQVMGNEAGLTQCFSNLLGNAVKFVKPGQTPDVCVSAERRNGWVRVCVADKGIGIGKPMLNRVFEMFSRGHRGYDGTGIGLALVRKVVDRMGGRVGVESEEGRGSQFWIELKAP